MYSVISYHSTRYILKLAELLALISFCSERGKMDINCSAVEPPPEACTLNTHISTTGCYCNNPDVSSAAFVHLTAQPTSSWGKIYYSHCQRNIHSNMTFIGLNVCSLTSINRSVSNLALGCIHLRFHLVPL